MTPREKLATLRTLYPNVPDLRREVPDAEAVAIAQEIGAAGLRHGQKAAAAADAFSAVLATSAPEGDAALEAWVAARAKARAAFWAEFEGEVVDGVTIIQVRA